MTEPRRRVIFDVVAIAIVVATAAWMMHRGWGTWADPIHNTGRELQIARQLADGKVLYREIAHLNGPLSQQLNARLFRSFGPRVSTLTIANLIWMSALVAMIWWLWRQIADALAAAVACVVFVVLFALTPGSRSFNFALPYEHEATHGLILSFAALCALARYLFTLRVRWLIVAGCGLGLALLTKIGIFASAFVPIIVGVIASAYANRATRRQLIGQLASIVAPIGVIAFIALSLMLNELSMRQAIGAIFGSARWIAHPQLLAMPWYRDWLGITDVGRSFDEMLVCSLAYVGLLGPAVVMGMFARRRGEWRTAALIVAPALVLIVMFVLYDTIKWGYAFRGLTPLSLAGAIAFGASLLHRNRREIDRVLILRLCVVWFALFMLAHLGLRALIAEYGFCFAMPATLVAIAAGVSWVPQIIDRAGGFGWASRAAMLAVIAAIGVVFVQRDDYQLARPRVSIGEGIDALAFDERGQAISDMLHELRDRARPGDTLLVAPDGAMINYLSGLRNPTTYPGLMPPEIAMFGGPQRVRDAVAASPPNWFILTSDNAGPFGFKSFAVDYGREIWRWIEPRYDRVATVGDERFAMQLYQRRASTSARSTAGKRIALRVCAYSRISVPPRRTVFAEAKTPHPCPLPECRERG